MEPIIDVTVLIPTRNRRAFFEDTLKQIARQDYAGKVQIVASINGSKDDTAQFVEGFDASVFTNRGWEFEFEVHAKTLSIQDNWNFLLSKAKGKYFAFHLDDDAWDADYLSHNISLLKQHSECSLVISGGRNIGMDESISKGWVESSVHQPPPLGGVLQFGVNNTSRVLNFFVSRPNFNFSQLIFVTNSRRFEKLDGTHFDVGYVLTRLLDGPFYLSADEKMTVRIDPDSYGLNDLLKTNQDRELAISKAYTNILSRLQQNRNTLPALREFALRRAGRSFIQFVKSVLAFRPIFSFALMTATLIKGAVKGEWKQINNLQISKDDL